MNEKIVKQLIFLLKGGILFGESVTPVTKDLLVRNLTFLVRESIEIVMYYDLYVISDGKTSWRSFVLTILSSMWHFPDGFTLSK